MLLVPLQHRGSSLTTSVRPRAEKDGENTQGQVGLDRGHQRPEVGLLRGEMPSCVVFRLTNSSIRQPLASLLLSKFNTRLRRSPHCWACLGPGEMRGTVTDSVDKHRTLPATFNLFLVPLFLRVAIQRQTPESHSRKGTSDFTGEGRGRD